LKSNLYSIFIFLIGLITTYIATGNVQQFEINKKRQDVTIQSQAITHTIQQQIYNYAQQLSTSAQRFYSIDQLNRNWATEIEMLIQHHPQLSNINIYLIEQQPTLTIDDDQKQYFATQKQLLKHAKHLLELETNPSSTESRDTILSKHKTDQDNQVSAYLHAPVFNTGKLIGYLEATLNITALLDYQVDRYQLTYPFSLSESGRHIYSILPEDTMINDIQQQFIVPLLGHNWKLMVWPKHQFHCYQFVPYIGLLLSILIAQLFYLVLLNRITKEQLKKQNLHLTYINNEFTVSKSSMVQSNKLSSLGEIAAGIAHEINQPLQVICIHSEICKESLQQKDYHMLESSFQCILSQVERIEKIVKQVGSFARNSELDNYNKQSPTAIFDNVISIVINQYNQDKVELRQVLPASLPALLCNKTQIEQVLVNLLINAKDAVEECSEKIVFIKAHNKEGRLYIEVSDSGCGIEQNKLNDIFTPFYTTKALGRGTGLGLSISYSIIHQHDGELQVTSEIGKGSTFTVILPLS